ncbi:MAG TPA: hypothetical protein DCF84_06655 [Bacteroidetes bacterium]|nr:hypothetical protein [Bacteroidota bacterium]|tara:strand:+ start:2267 stop:3112 length:846 start_codon:yes stop_codon:yes gene_type:complete
MKFGYANLEDSFTIQPRKFVVFNEAGHPPNQGNKNRIVTGLSSFSHPEWIGTIYPSSTPRKQMFTAYSKVFSGIEFNGTRYKFPSPDQIAKWSDQTNEGFAIYPKLPQSISHAKRYDQDEIVRRIEDFVELATGFGPRLGRCFLCFPSHVGADRLEELLSLIGGLDRNIPLAIELRHSSWFVPHSIALYSFSEALSKKNVSLIITDTPGRQDVFHSYITSNNLMVRFVASGNRAADTRRIKVWRDLFEQYKSWLSLACFVHSPTEKKDHLMPLMKTLQATS